MDVLLSIKPRYVRRILEGSKEFEFRKQVFKKRSQVDYVYIYATAPEKKIVARFSIGGIKRSSPYELWEECEDGAGVEKEEFYEYFEGCREAFAIEIEEVEELNESIKLSEMEIRPPQSFRYVDIDSVTKKQVKEREKPLAEFEDFSDMRYPVKEVDV